MPRILFRRGSEANLPKLLPGEPAVTTDSEKLFFGSPVGNVELPKKKDIENLQEQVDSLEGEVSAANQRFNDLQLVDANAEVLAARGGEVTLGNRLDKVTSDLADIANVTGVKVEEFKRNTGETDDSGRIQRAINSIPAPQVKATFIFAEKQYDFSSSITLPNIPISLITLVGTVINTLTSNPAFLHTNHKKLEVIGFTFKGAGNGIKTNMVLAQAMSKDFEIKDCDFEMNSGVYGIYLYGAREGIIEGCKFKSGKGIYRQDTANTIVERCMFMTDLEVGIFDDGSVGANAAYSCGLYLLHSFMIGVVEGVIIQYTDHFTIEGCMIDYCDKPVQIYGQDGGVICGGTYISSRTTNPAIRIAKGGASVDKPRNIKITDSFVLGHATDPFSCIYISDGAEIDIRGTDVTFYTEYGIKYENTTNLKIDHVNFSPRSGFGLKSIKSITGDDSSNMTSFSKLDQLPDTEFMVFKECRGYVTKQSGVTTINQGDSFAAINHALAKTPTIIQLTTDQNVQAYPAGLYSTSFAIYLTASAPALTKVYWTVEV